jgi:hypothetical protein
VRIYPERTSEAKILRLGPWLRDRILLIDLGYFKYLFFDRIDGYGGFFVSRLKGNANPRIVGVNRKCLRLIRNANPENANRYTPLRWVKVFSEQADRLLTEVLECTG